MVKFAWNCDRGWDKTFRIGAILTLAAVALFNTERSPVNAATRTEKNFGSWGVICIEPDNQEKSCSMMQSQIQTFKGSNKRRLVLRWAISSSKSEQTQVVVVPTGVSTQDGVRLFLGDAAPVTIGYRYCGQRVCIGTAPIDAKAIAAIKAAKKASASYVLGSKKLVQVDLDLNGFGQAYDYLIQQLS
jgi:invasion protein IalB